MIYLLLGINTNTVANSASSFGIHSIRLLEEQQENYNMEDYKEQQQRNNTNNHTSEAVNTVAKQVFEEVSYKTKSTDDNDDKDISNLNPQSSSSIPGTSTSSQLPSGMDKILSGDDHTNYIMMMDERKTVGPFSFACVQILFTGVIVNFL